MIPMTSTLATYLGVDREPGDGGQLEVDLGQQQREEGAGLLSALRHGHRHVTAQEESSERQVAGNK